MINEPMMLPFIILCVAAVVIAQGSPRPELSVEQHFKP